MFDEVERGWRGCDATNKIVERRDSRKEKRSVGEARRHTMNKCVRMRVNVCVFMLLNVNDIIRECVVLCVVVGWLFAEISSDSHEIQKFSDALRLTNPISQGHAQRRLDHTAQRITRTSCIQLQRTQCAIEMEHTGYTLGQQDHSHLSAQRTGPKSVRLTAESC